MLRVSGALTGHRYLFGLTIPGGLSKDLDDAACREALRRCQEVLGRLNRLEQMLRFTSSFLDRLEEVGFIPERNAFAYGLVGPIARASGVGRDLRKVQPYAGYESFSFDIPIEREGDGYARLRILFEEARRPSHHKSTVYGLNGRRAHFVIALSLVAYEHAILENTQF